MAKGVSRQPVTAKARVRSQVSPCQISGGLSGKGTDFYPSILGFPRRANATDSTTEVFDSTACAA